MPAFSETVSGPTSAFKSRKRLGLIIGAADRWHWDEVFLKIKERLADLWLALDQANDVMRITSVGGKRPYRVRLFPQRPTPK